MNKKLIFVIAICCLAVFSAVFGGFNIAFAKQSVTLDSYNITFTEQYAKQSATLNSCNISFAEQYAKQSAAFGKYDVTLAEQADLIRVIYDKAPIYDCQNFLSLDSTQRQQHLVCYATLHQTFVVLQDCEDVYQIQLEQTQGYILKSMTIDNKIKSPQKALNYNAQIIVDCPTFIKDDQTYTQSTLTLKNGDRVCILDGYDSQKEYTYVSVYSDGILQNIYVKTQVLKCDGINAKVVVTISLILAVCTILMIIIKLLTGKKKRCSTLS